MDVDLTTSPESQAKPDWHFLLSHPAHALALDFGVGLLPQAPGTFGTLLAFPLYWLLEPRLGAYAFLALIGLLFLLGIWACGRAGRAIGIPDHGGIVWDETVAFLLVLFFTPKSLLWQGFAFLLFRLFDVVKPPPIGYLDATMKNGLGVMLDDLIAALYALICLAIWKAM